MAADRLRKQKFDVEVLPHAKGPQCGTYAASDADRLADLTAALTDPSVDAILCARGGYGCNHLIDKILVDTLRANAKPIIGFSDVTALHAMMQHAGLPSLHAPMAKHIATEDPWDYCTMSLYSILRQWPDPKYDVSLPLENTSLITPSAPFKAQGMLTGGNLAVFNGLADTPFDPLTFGGDTPLILLIEDISEAIYAVERMLIRLRLSSRLKRVKAVLVGSFTEYKPNLNYHTMEEMVQATLGTEVPLILGFPSGHTPDNIPLIMGADTTIEVTDKELRLSQRIK